MKKSQVFSGTGTVIAAVSVLVCCGCGYYEDAFDDAARNTLGTCKPQTTDNGCKLIYKCGDAPPFTVNRAEQSPCIIADGMAQNEIDGVCIDGECQIECGNDGSNPCPMTPCNTSSCDNGICKFATEDDGTSCERDSQMSGVCRDGTCVECINQDQCSLQFCNNNQCVPLQDLGAKCNVGAECSSGICVENVCCFTKCDQECWSCNVQPWAGYCNPVPAGDSDNSCDAMSKVGCGVKLGQIGNSCQNKLLNETKCQEDSNCLSHKCVETDSGTKKCKQNGGICANDEECASNKCANSWCEVLL